MISYLKIFNCCELANLFNRFANETLSTINTEFYVDVNIFLQSLGDHYSPKNFQKFSKLIIQIGLSLLKTPKRHLVKGIVWNADNKIVNYCNNDIPVPTVDWFKSNMINILMPNVTINPKQNIEFILIQNFVKNASCKVNYHYKSTLGPFIINPKALKMSCNKIIAKTRIYKRLQDLRKRHFEKTSQ